MRRGPRVPFAWLFLLGSLAACPAAGPGALGAQVTAGNPHGPLPEGMDCGACHLTTAWVPVKPVMEFTHGAVSGFRLTGEHSTATCVSCHDGLRFDGPKAVPSDCVFCHVDVHERQMTAPCASCHSTESFREVSGVAVHLQTAFPLTGAHAQVSCESCHVDDSRGFFAGAPLGDECVACHLAAYEGAQTIDHVASGYSTDCTQCHSSLAWADAPAFDHEGVSGGFALLGAHATLRCGSCHAVPGYALLFPTPAGDTDCVACHQADYDQEHSGTGFPTTCVTCHTVDDWDGAFFAHDSQSFPIYSGAHRNRWNDCSACHLTPGDFTSFTCLTCHTPSETNGHHDDVSGYIYQSPACYSCHPDGRS